MGSQHKRVHAHQHRNRRKAMPNGSRRNFLVTAGSFALALGGSARAAMSPDDKFDLLIKGGDALDPSQSLRGVRDIGIRYGVIEAVEPDIPAARALRVLDATGKLVTPGLIDLHCHVFPYGQRSGFRRTSSSPINARRLASPRAMPAPTILRRSAATWSRRRARGSMLSCTSRMWDSRRSRYPSFTTSISPRLTRRRKPSPRM